MWMELVEIYSDKTNAAVLRHPGRHFPGVLVQGDNLYGLWQRADLLCAEIGPGSPGYERAEQLREALWSWVSHYKATLAEHGMRLPFSEEPIG